MRHPVLPASLRLSGLGNYLAVGGGLMWVCFCSDSVNRCCDTSCFFSPLERLGFGLVVRFFFLCVLQKVLIIRWPLLRTASSALDVCRVSVLWSIVLPLLEALDVFVTLVLAVVMACTLGGPCVYFA